MLRDALLVIVLRDAELYGEDDIVATATVTLLGLPAAATADAATLAFRADLIHATERVGECAAPSRSRARRPCEAAAGRRFYTVIAA